MRVRGTIHGEIPGGIAERPLGAGARRTGKDLMRGPGRSVAVHARYGQSQGGRGLWLAGLLRWESEG